MNKINKFFRWLWNEVKGLVKTRIGRICLLISFMIFCGWALVFIVIGIFTNNAWFYGAGIAVVLFWAGPFTPMWPLIISTAMFMNKLFKRRKK